MATTNPNCWPGTNVPRTWANAFLSTPAETPKAKDTWLESGTKVGKLRACLEHHGEMTASQLGNAAGIDSSTVCALLNRDIRAGRVIQRPGMHAPIYELVKAES